MGKGVPAALLGAATKNEFSKAFSSLITLHSDRTLPEIYEIVANVNAAIVEQLINLESFVTLCYARIDLEKGIINFVNCGHTKTIYWRARTRECEERQGEFMPIGFTRTEDYSQETANIEPGDVICFYSDGVTESRNTQGELFGEDRLIEVVKTSEGLKPEELIQKVRQEVIYFTGSNTFSDDLTVIALKIHEGALDQVEWRIANDLAELSGLRSNLVAFIKNAHPGLMDEVNINRMELALNEAASNIIKHAYKGKSDEEIKIRVEIFPNRLVLRLFHHGNPFDRSTAEPPVFDGSRDNGFGVYVIDQCFDLVNYVTEGSGEDCIVLTKFLK